MGTETESAAVLRALVADTSTDWERQPPASTEAIAALQDEAGWRLPVDYVAFLHLSNGGNGYLGVQPGWFQLWKAEEVIAFNAGYEVATSYGPYFGFGTSGGGEMLCFNRGDAAPSQVYLFPFIGGPERRSTVAEDFLDFVRKMGHKWNADEE